MEAQVEEIESFKVEAKVARDSVVQNFIDHFEEHELYGTIANYWASWNAQTMLQRLREVHPNLDISALEEEFGGPIGGRPNCVAAKEAIAALEEAGVGKGPLFLLSRDYFCIVIASAHLL